MIKKGEWYMKYKKSMIMLVLLIFIFAATSVCASDVNDTVIAGEDDSAVELPQDDGDGIISTDENELIGQTDNELISEGNSGTFAELQAYIKAAGSTLTLNKSYECEDGFDSEGIIIDKTITIDGQGFKIDAQGKSRIFKITADNVVLKNIIFTNGKTTGNGGAVYFTSEGTLSNCNFADNSANGLGGAVYFEGNGNMSNCNFINNSASNYMCVIYFSSNGTIKSSSFINNHGLDGIVGSLSRSSVTLTVKDSIFLDNSGSQVIHMEYGSCIADYNWFGNTYLNRDAAPELGSNVECNVWFYLDVDDLRNFNVGDSKTVNYNLNTNNKNVVYDMSNVSAMTFDVSSRYGLADAGSIELVGGHASVLYTYLEDDKNDLTITNGTFSFTLSTFKLYVNGSVSVSGDGSKTMPFKTLKEAYDAAGNGDVIYIASGTYNGTGSGAVPNIDKQITLDTYGDGPVIFDGEKSRIIFSILEDNVVIRGITFINVNSNSGGAVVWDGADGVLCNCSFVNNSAFIVVDWMGTDGVLSYCSFVNNSADCGAVQWLDADGVLSYCSFVNNSGLLIFILLMKITFWLRIIIGLEIMHPTTTSNRKNAMRILVPGCF